MTTTPDVPPADAPPEAPKASPARASSDSRPTIADRRGSGAHTAGPRASSRPS
jgi:hypothetical protein